MLKVWCVILELNSIKWYCLLSLFDTYLSILKVLNHTNLPSEQLMIN